MVKQVMVHGIVQSVFILNISMLKYLYSQVYTKEIPNELSLGISILGCPIHCPECHSPHTWDINCKDEGIELTTIELDRLIQANKWVSCILFYGGEWSEDIQGILIHCRKSYDYKIALYSGHSLEYIEKLDLLDKLDYIKVGHYDHQLGGLIYPSTNQRLYTIQKGKIDKDITSLFWKTNIT